MSDQDNARAVCEVCPHTCALKEGQFGLCRARFARNGKVVSDSYGRITSMALDPIEKKPLARFMPGSHILSIGSFGCNLRCPFCQNASISQAGSKEVAWRDISPEELISRALSLRSQGNVGIAYTYNEPLINYEFIRDCAQLAHEQGLVNVLVSNGMGNTALIDELSGLIDAANIDLKGFTQDLYSFVGGDLATVKRTIEMLAVRSKCHVEVTTLVIPGLNDSDEEIDRISQWIASLDPEIPYHVSRFFPCYRLLDRPATPIKQVKHLAEVARDHLRFVFTGNC